MSPSGLNLTSGANVESACNGSITKKTVDQIYRIMDDLEFTSALWLTESTGI